MIAALWTSLALSLLASSRPSGFDTQLFVPAAHDGAFITVESGEVRGDGTLRAALLSDYEQQPLGAAYRADATLLLAFTAADRLSIALAVPVTLQKSGVALDDIRVGAKIAVWRRGVDVAARLSLSLPTGSPATLTGDATARGSAELDVSRRFGAWRAALDAGFVYRTPATFATSRAGPELTARAALGFTFSRLPIEVIAEISGQTQAARPFAADNALTADIAARVSLPAGFSVIAGAGRGFTFPSALVGAPALFVFAGVELRLFTGREATHDAPPEVRLLPYQREPVVEPPSLPALVPEAALGAQTSRVAVPVGLLADPQRRCEWCVFFATGRAALMPKSKAALTRIAEVLSAHPQLVLHITGHTDGIGSDAYNLWLSQRRAARVRNFLLRRGVSDTHLQTLGLGKRAPLTSNALAAGRRRNRRVAFVVAPETGRPTSDASQAH